MHFLNFYWWWWSRLPHTPAADVIQLLFKTSCKTECLVTLSMSMLMCGFVQRITRKLPHPLPSVFSPLILCNEHFVWCSGVCILISQTAICLHFTGVSFQWSCSPCLNTSAPCTTSHFLRREWFPGRILKKFSQLLDGHVTCLKCWMIRNGKSHILLVVFFTIMFLMLDMCCHTVIWGWR